jgi:Skp family chaperone for outer membrane proteins
MMSETETATATTEAPETTQSATAAYNAKQEELREEEGRLAALQRRQDAGERLSREERVTKWTLAEDVEQLRQEVEALVAAKEAEQLAMAIEAVVDVWNHWTVPHREGPALAN